MQQSFKCEQNEIVNNLLYDTGLCFENQTTRGISEKKINTKKI